jgi:FKBP-type peptidyl-prolyl cis-trans isomerase
MKFTKLILFLSFIPFFISCNKFSDYEKTETGLYYKIIERSGDTVTPAHDDLMKISITYAFDTVFYRSSESSKPIIIKNSGSNYPGDINEGLNMMKRGDSASFWTVCDSFFIKTLKKRPIPKIARKQDYININVKLLETFSQEEFDADVERQKLEEKENEPEKIRKFIEENQINVTPRESGLYYIENVAGTGEQPKEGDKIHVHFRVELLDGTEIYTSYNREPFIYKIGTAYDAPGIREGFELMRKGGKSQILVPSSIGFGEVGRGGVIPAYAPLFYNLEMVDIERKADIDKREAEEKRIQDEKNAKNKAEGVAFLKKIEKEPGVVKMPEGVLYKVIREGKGQQPGSRDKVKVHYKGTRVDGTVFDSSYERNKPSSFYVDKVIDGWTAALQRMPVGSKWIIYIPEELAYGANPRKGVIEPYDALVFEVELLEILPSKRSQGRKVIRN